MRLRLAKTKITTLAFVFILIFATITLAEKTDEPVVKNLSVDKKNRVISYMLTKPATVRLRVGSRAGPLYRTLVNWQKQGEGDHAIKWDGMDASGFFNILDNANFTFSFNYYLDGQESPPAIESPEGDFIFSDYFIGRVPKTLHLSQNHKNHNKERCKDLEAVFVLPGNIRKTKEGLARIKGMCPIMIGLSDKDKLWFRQERFGINIYIDDVFVQGEALGYIPYTWNFNPEGLNAGKHLIIVNLKGFNDHTAVANLPVYIEAAK